MRIIAGTAKGRRLAAPRSGTRPMTDRARESLFSVLGGRLEDARVLDLYAGSGSLGLEALSRGATEAVFVERSRDAVRVLQDNVDAVALGGTIIRSDVEDALARLQGAFDLIFVDPPYADDDGQVSAVLTALDDLLADGGVVVVHRHSSSEIVVPEFLTCVDERRYGDAVVTVMERLET